jgi:hypothetical protein
LQEDLMPSKETLEQFGCCWEGLEDPRSGNAGLHDFHEMLMIALCCVLCGGQGAVDMAVFAEAKGVDLLIPSTGTTGFSSLRDAIRRRTWVRVGDYTLKWIAAAKCAQWHS